MNGIEVEATIFGHNFHRHCITWNKHVNGRVQDVPSHAVIREHINHFDGDYRREVEPNPVPELQDRTHDNTTIARSQ